MKQFVAAADQIRIWLDSSFNADGVCRLAPNDARFYFKAPYWLMKAGLHAKGMRVAKHIRDTFIDSHGDLIGPPGFTPQIQLYGMGWITLGAVMVERFDLARTVARRLAERIDRTMLSYPAADPEVGEAVGDLQTTGGAGMGLVASGWLDDARLLCERMALHMDAQPEPRRLYSRFRRDGSVVTHLPDGRRARVMDLDLDDQGSAGLAPGVLMLTWLSRATGDLSFRATAGRYVEFVYGNRHDPATFSRSTKFGWAMLELYEDTGDERLLKRATDLGAVLASRLTKAGCWNPLPVRHDAPPSDLINYSADCAMTVLSLAALPDGL